MEATEQEMRELVMFASWEIRKKIINEMLEYWDRYGTGCFGDFVRNNFYLYWLSKAGRN